MFIGEYWHNMDNKGRIAVPVKFRIELGETVILTRSLDSCLALYTASSWQKKAEELMALSFNQHDNRQYIRSVVAAASEGTFDAQGRILIPQPLIKAAGLEKECVFVGMLDHAELWSKASWEKYNSELTDEHISAIAEKM